MAIWDLAGRVWTLARKVEDMTAFQDKVERSLNAIDIRIRTLEDRLTHNEAGQGQMITEAKAAAGVAATGLASSVLSDVVTRITRLEMHADVRQADRKRRLPPA